jgi:hypothetical protein
LRAYVPVFEQGTWHFVTLSFEGTLPFSDNVYEIADYWDACGEALREAVDRKLIRGAYWVDEIKVLSFLPTTVIPHVHAVVEADCIDRAAFKLIEGVVRKKLKTVGKKKCKPTLQPNIEVKCIATEKSLYNRVRYLYKPIELKQPYQQAWELVEAESRGLAIRLNSEVRSFVEGHFLICSDRRRMHVKGNLSPNCKRADFLGVVKDDRRLYTGQIRDLARQTSQYEWADDEAASNQEEVDC